jgi:hypothetical protein
VKKIILASLALVALGGCVTGGSDDKPEVLPVCTKIERVNLRLDPSLEPHRASFQRNLERVMAIVNTYPGKKWPVTNVLIQRGCYGPGPKVKECVWSYRFQEWITMHIWCKNPDGQCGGSGVMDPAHWSGALCWEIAHWYECTNGGRCDDTNYTLPDAAKLDREIYGLAWEGEEVRQ